MDKRISEIIDKIRSFNGDQKISIQDTIDGLEDIAVECECLIEALKEQL